MAGYFKCGHPRMPENCASNGHGGVQCRECKNENERKYREENGERVRGYKRRYYEKNRGEVLERDRAYRKDNPEKVRKYRREYHRRKAGWYDDNPELPEVRKQARLEAEKWLRLNASKN